jgi:hypothetical protein
MLDTPWGTLSIIVAISGSVWSMAWWLNGHFNSIRKDFSSLAKEIIDKLEYHERHDDTRFSQIRDDIWDIRVRNAAVDGNIKPSQPHKEHK